MAADPEDADEMRAHRVWARGADVLRSLMREVQREDPLTHLYLEMEDRRRLDIDAGWTPRGCVTPAMAHAGFMALMGSPYLRAAAAEIYHAMDAARGGAMDAPAKLAEFLPPMPLSAFRKLTAGDGQGEAALSAAGTGCQGGPLPLAMDAAETLWAAYLEGRAFTCD